MSWIVSNALMKDYVNSHYSRVLAEDCLEAIYLDGAQSALSSGIPMQLVYLSPDKMTAFSRLSRFGMMCKPLTADLGEDLLMWYREDFRAKTLAVQGKEQESPERGQECGHTWRGSLAKYDHYTHSLRTAQCSLLEDLTLSCVTLPRWGTMRNGELYQQRTAALHTRGKESGSLLATPTATANQLAPSMMKHKGCAMWATPKTMDKLPPKSPEALEREATVARPGRSKPANLRDQVSNMQNWPTPTAHNAKEQNSPSESLRNTPTLASIAGGKLNPMWVEWLMGWPLGWTDLQQLEMGRFQCAQQQHSAFYQGE